MIIILEGPDNAGKSTLGNKLSVDLGIDLVHPGGPPKNIVEVINRCQEQSNVFNMSTAVDVMFDRITCISDQIYRGRPEFDNVFIAYQNHLRSCKNVIVIYCRPSDDRVKNFDDHVQKDHEDAAVVQHAKDNVDRIVYDYDSLMAMFQADQHFNVIQYNFEADQDGCGYREMLNLLESRRDVK